MNEVEEIKRVEEFINSQLVTKYEEFNISCNFHYDEDGLFMKIILVVYDDYSDEELGQNVEDAIVEDSYYVGIPWTHNMDYKIAVQEFLDFVEEQRNLVNINPQLITIENGVVTITPYVEPIGANNGI